MVALLILPAYNISSAQIGLRSIANKVKNKIEEKVDEKVEKKVDQEVEKSVDKKLDEALQIDSTYDNSEKAVEERNNARGQRILNHIGMNSTPAKYENSYSFSSNVKMTTESYDKKGKLESKGSLNTYWGSNMDVYAYEIIDEERSADEKGFFIFDAKNMVSIILSENKDEKSGVVTGLDLSQMAVPDSLKNAGGNVPVNDKVKKTGNSKTILGYRCDEYMYEDEYDVSNVWITKDKTWKTGNLFGSVYKNPNLANGFPQGFVMEADTKNKSTGERGVMRVTEINEKIKKDIDLTGYELVNLGSLKMQ
jgi:hypothetical protein